MAYVFFFAGNLQDGGKLYARMWAPALGVEEDAATGGACAALVGAMASKPDYGGTAYRLSIQQGVSMGREIEAEARKSDGAVTSVSVAPRPTSQAAKSRCRRPRLCLRPSSVPPCA